MMNGNLVKDVTHRHDSVSLRAILDYPNFEAKDRIDALYLTTLSRYARPSEIQRLTTYIDNQASEEEAYSDIFWALLNSSEFKFNH